jgi:predicted cupin superfamily sugar epimerase
MVMSPSLSSKEIIRLLDLAPHPEGGHFRETFRDKTTDQQGIAQ